MPRLSEYDYLLPEELVAQEPLAERTASRLLYLDRQSGFTQDKRFVDLRDLLRPGDLLVFNNTRVTALRLLGNKKSGGKVEALLLREMETGRYECLVKPAKRLPVGTEVFFSESLVAKVEELLPDGKRVLTFSDSAGLTAKLSSVGRVPLPPYIHATLDDPERYQTVFAKEGGSAAAPTAALHFTLGFLEELRSRDVDFAEVTLDVGIDTFRPVQVEDLDDHVMHGESCSVPPETAFKISACRGRVIAVGTTSVRTLESFAEAPRRLGSGTRNTRLFIKPGFRFQIVDGILTNFHLPRTTMLLMISAFCSRELVLEAYRHAVNERYRFLSFGDAMLIV